MKLEEDKENEATWSKTSPFSGLIYGEYSYAVGRYVSYVSM